MNQFEDDCQTIIRLIDAWELRLKALDEKVVTDRKNNQDRSIRQIIGHLIDSASNNTHRIVHFQYRENPMSFPNYATNGNNDRWISIQNYQQEDWINLVQLWKYANLHLIHVIRNVDLSKLENQWISNEIKLISLKANMEGYLPHFELHLSEVEELISLK